jgi:TP901 family phage tail tape measure protein
MYNLASAGMNATQVMGSAESAVKLAGATAADMSLATGLMSASLKTFNIDASQSGRVTDLFAQTVRKSQFTLQGLSDAMRYAGPTGAAFGMTLEETTASVAMFKNLGLEATQAGTGFRQAMIALASPTDTVSDALNSLGVNLAEVNPATVGFDGVVQRLAQTNMTASQAFEIFGARAGGAMKAIIEQHRSGQADINSFFETIKNNTGTATEMYDTMMNTVEGRWQIFKSNISELLLTIFDAYKGQVKEALEIGSTFIENLTAIFEQIQPVVTMLAEYFLEFFRIMGKSMTGFTQGFTLTGQETGAIAVKIMDFFTGMGNVIIKVFETINKYFDWFRLAQAKMALGVANIGEAFGIMSADIGDAIRADIENINKDINAIGTFRETFNKAAESAKQAAMVVMTAKKEETQVHEESTKKMIANVKQYQQVQKQAAEDVKNTKIKAVIEAEQKELKAQDELLKHIKEQNKQALQNEENFRNASLQSLSGALNESIRQGKSWADATRDVMKKLTDTLIDQLVTLAAQAAATQAAMAFTGGGGGLVGGLAGVGISAIGEAFKGIKFAEGGIVTRPTIGMVGEAGPEAIIPLNQAGGIGKRVYQTINVNVTGVLGDDFSMDKLARKIKPYSDRVAQL